LDCQDRVETVERDRSTRLEVGADPIKEGLGGIFLEGTVKARIGTLFEDFRLVVRVIHDYRGSCRVIRADNDVRIRTKIGDSCSFCSGEVVM